MKLTKIAEEWCIKLPAALILLAELVVGLTKIPLSLLSVMCLLMHDFILEIIFSLSLCRVFRNHGLYPQKQKKG